VAKHAALLAKRQVRVDVEEAVGRQRIAGIQRFFRDRRVHCDRRIMDRGKNSPWRWIRPASCRRCRSSILCRARSIRSCFFQGLHDAVYLLVREGVDRLQVPRSRMIPDTLIMVPRAVFQVRRSLRKAAASMAVKSGSVRVERVGDRDFEVLHGHQTRARTLHR